MKPLKIRHVSLQSITRDPSPLRQYTNRILWGLLSVSMLSWVLFALAWGVNYDQEDHAHALKVRVFDLDSANQGALVGPALRRFITQDGKAKPRLGWDVEDDVDTKNETAVHETAQELVLSHEVFAAVVVAGNATSSAVDAWTGGHLNTYEGDKAVTWYYEEARSRDTVK